MKIPLFFYPLIIAIMVSIIRIRYISPLHLRYIIFYLIASLLIETTGLITINYGIRNTGLFNVYTVIEFVFWLYIFYKSIVNYSFKSGILFFIPIYIILTVINQIFIQGFYKFHSITFLIGCFSLIIVTSFYLYETIALQLKKSPASDLLFWVSIGLLLFYVSDFMYLALFNYLINERMEIAKTLQKAVRINNFIMYCVFVIGLIWTTQNQK